MAMHEQGLALGIHTPSDMIHIERGKGDVSIHIVQEQMQGQVIALWRDLLTAKDA